MRNNVVTILAAFIALFGTVQSAVAGVIWEQSILVPGRGVWQISNSVIANDFEVTQSTNVTGFKVWLSDEDSRNDNGVFDDFDNTLGFGIYDDSSGLPGNLILSGQSKPTLVDTGLQAFTAFNSTADIFTAEISLPSLLLDPGLYWLALHEGDWQSTNDGSEVGWIQAGFTQELSSVAFDSNETTPGNYLSTGSNRETVFQMFGEQASNSVPVPTTLPLLGIALLGLVMVRRKL